MPGGGRAAQQGTAETRLQAWLAESVFGSACTDLHQTDCPFLFSLLRLPGGGRAAQQGAREPHSRAREESAPALRLSLPPRPLPLLSPWQPSLLSPFLCPSSHPPSLLLSHSLPPLSPLVQHPLSLPKPCQAAQGHCRKEQERGRSGRRRGGGDGRLRD